MFLVMIFGHVLLLTAHVTNAYVINGHANMLDTTPKNLCQPPCSALCSPDCLADCCVTKSEIPISAPATAATSAPAAPVAPAPSPAFQQAGVTRQQPMCSSVSPGPDGRAPGGHKMMITSVEEGETEECSDRGFQSPTDSTEDPPGTITIPLPDTMYVPPKAGEQPKEIPMPDFPIPAAVLDGKFPEKSIKMEPIVATQGGIQSGGQFVSSQGPDLSKTAQPCITPPASMIAASPPPPVALPPAPAALSPAAPTTYNTNQQAVVSITPSLHVAPPPAVHIPPPPLAHVPPPPPCGVTQTMPSGGTLVYPKLPPVTVSEIPKKKIPPNLLNKPGVVNPLAAALARPVKPLSVCPPLCTGIQCAPGCRDECCKQTPAATAAAASQTSQIAAALATALQNAAHVVTPLGGAAPAPAPAPTAFSSGAAALPACGGGPHDDSCTIHFGPPPAAPASPSLHSYPPADMPTDVAEVNPTAVSLQQACSEMQKMDEKILKEMEDKLTATCVSG